MLWGDVPNDGLDPPWGPKIFDEWGLLFLSLEKQLAIQGGKCLKLELESSFLYALTQLSLYYREP